MPVGQWLPGSLLKPRLAGAETEWQTQDSTVMHEIKDTQRALVRIGYDGRVHKTFRGPYAAERFRNEIQILKYLERKKCDFVPRLLESDESKLYMVTTNCGSRVERMGEERVKKIFAELEEFGVCHDDPFLRNITYRPSDGRFCVIDFEFASITDDPGYQSPFPQELLDKLEAEKKP